VLNLVNQGQIAELPRGVFVETPVMVDGQGVTPEPMTLPAPVAAYCRKTAAVTAAIVGAGMARKRELVREAVELDPTIVNKAAGWEAMQECMNADSDILLRWE
jgi:alpha-galactosidase/6-phospho-beta-glucosidase family protein